MESRLINFESGRLPRPASNVRWNAGLAMTESLFHPKRTTKVVSSYKNLKEHIFRNILSDDNRAWVCIALV